MDDYDFIIDKIKAIRLFNSFMKIYENNLISDDILLKDILSTLPYIDDLFIFNQYETAQNSFNFYLKKDCIFVFLVASNDIRKQELLRDIKLALNTDKNINLIKKYNITSEFK